jgi:hypothetical protein
MIIWFAPFLRYYSLSGKIWIGSFKQAFYTTVNGGKPYNGAKRAQTDQYGIPPLRVLGFGRIQNRICSRSILLNGSTTAFL